jgi:hypothetical protein
MQINSPLTNNVIKIKNATNAILISITRQLSEQGLFSHGGPANNKKPIPKERKPVHNSNLI